jgi:hypothetical protein
MAETKTYLRYKFTRMETQLFVTSALAQAKRQKKGANGRGESANGASAPATTAIDALLGLLIDQNPAW